MQGSAKKKANASRNPPFPKISILKTHAAQIKNRLVNTMNSFKYNGCEVNFMFAVTSFNTSKA